MGEIAVPLNAQCNYKKKKNHDQFVNRNRGETRRIDHLSQPRHHQRLSHTNDAPAWL